MSESADRWKIDGDCSKCRRRLYCKKACRLNEKRVTGMMTKMIYDKTGLGEIMNYLRRSR
jgi:radical SAM protein with 4Fe4S-binding SPASM domain